MDWREKYKKAVTFSYDDGVEQDVRLVEIFNKYGIKCTFNLNTGLDYNHGTWKCGDFWVHRLNLPETAELYDGHEIAVHGRQHLCLTELSPEELHTELYYDAAEIERIFGVKPVGMAYSYGAYNEAAIEKLREMGIRYARTVGSSYSFDEQDDLLLYRPTCHHEDERLFELVDEFLSTESDKPQVLYIWGHSYEFEERGNWDRFEKLCSILGGRDDIFYGTNKQVLLYED